MVSQYWEGLALLKSLYVKMGDPILKKYDLTRMELDILLFLANNRELNKASDMVEKRQLTKSHVSTSIGDLKKKGYLREEKDVRDRRSIRLYLTEKADPIVDDGQKMQKEYIEVIFDGVDREFLERASKCQSEAIERVRRRLDELEELKCSCSLK